MRVGIDFDGVISDTIPQMIDFARATHGLDLSPFDCVAPDGPAGLGIDAWLRLITDTHATAFALTIPPTNGAVAALRELATSHEIVIVTARRGEGLDNTRGWLDRVGLTACIGGIVSSAGRTKADVAHELQLAMLVDDIPENLRDFRSAVHPVLWDATYNRDTETEARITRVHGWSDLAALLRRGSAP